MAKSSLFLSLACIFAFTASANAQTNLYLLGAPSDGAVRPIAGNSALLYVGTESSIDSFSIGTEDPNGFSLIDVNIVGGTALISNVDFGGPLALSASTMLLSKTGGNTTPQTPPANESPAEEEDEPFVVIIYVDQPGEGGDRDVNEGTNVGHTFIEVINGETGESTTVGLYPDKPVRPWDTEVDGEIRDDSDHPWDVQTEIEITEEQYNEIMEQIEEDRQNPPDYDLNDCNCTDYVLDLLEELGIDIETDPADYPFPFGRDGRNPRNLGEDLVEDYDGERNEDPADGDGFSK